MNIRLFIISISILLIAIIVFLVGVPYLNNSEIEENINQLKNQKSVNSVSSILKSDNFEKLPTKIKNYLNLSIKNKSKTPTLCKIIYSGKIKSSPKSDWSELNSTLYFSTVIPSFIQISETKESFLLWKKIVDTYINGSASTTSKMISSIPLDSFSGNKLNSSYLVLYIMESIFSPTSLLPTINAQWKKINENSIEVSIWDKSVEAKAVFHFNDENKIVKITSQNRFMPGKTDYSKEKFTIYLANYKDIGDYYIPTYFELQWNLASGDYTFGRFQITNISFE